MPKPAPRVVAPTPDLEAVRDAIERARRRVVESSPIVVGLRAAWQRGPNELDTATARAIGDFLLSRLGWARWEPYRRRGWRWESIMLSTTEAAAGRLELVARTEADWHAATALLEGVANDLARLDGNAIEAAFGRRANWRTLVGEPRADLLLIDCLPSIAPDRIRTGTLAATPDGFAIVSTEAAAMTDAAADLERILPRERPVAWAEIADLREALRALLDAAFVRLGERADDAGTAESAIGLPDTEDASPPTGAGVRFEEDIGEPMSTTPAKPLLPRQERALRALTIWLARGLTQKEIARMLTDEYGVPCDQGTVSRLLREAKELDAGKVALAMAGPKARRERSVEPRRLDLGPRTDGRKPHRKDEG